jgi:methionyl-tRNA formyltransferase
LKNKINGGGRGEHQLGVVLFFGRVKCIYSEKIKKILKKNSKKFYFIKSKKIGENIEKKFLNIKYDYIFCFRSFYILRKNILKNTKKAAINFHPGPPEYRGTGCVNYAIYENSRFYGCTAYIMNEKIDNGKIIGVRRFKLNKKASVEQVLSKTYKIMFSLAIFIIKKILENPENKLKLIKKNIHNKWSNKILKLRDLNKFYEIPLKIKKKEFDRKILATYTKGFKPFIYLHKKKFILN